MFYLKEFPDERMIARLKAAFPQADGDAAQVFIRLMALGSECLANLDQVLAKHDLSHGRWLVLMLLRRKEVWEALPSELAREQGITKATMSGLTQRLEKQGLITRKPDEQDKRRTVLALTPKGAGVVTKVFPECIQLMIKILSPLDDKEKIKLRMLLEKLFPVCGEESPS